MYHHSPGLRRNKSLRFNGRRKPRRGWRFVGVLLAGSLVAAVGFAATVWWKGLPEPVETVSLRQGTVEELQPLDAWVVRDAAIYRAAEAGQVTRLVGEGERVRPNTPVVKLAPGDRQILAKSAGVVSYQLDGLEEVLTPENAAKWDIAKVRALAVPQGQKAAEGAVAAGAPLFKLVDNLKAGLLAVVPLSSSIVFETGGEVRVRLGDAQSRAVTATVLRTEQADAQRLLYLSVPDLAADLSTVQRVQATVVGKAVQGLIAPRSAIDVRNGLQGVWVVDGEQEEFVPVVVKGGNEQEVAMEADLKPGTKIRRAYPLRMR